MQGTGVVERSVLEDQTTEVTVSGDDVVGLFFLTELVTIVLGLSFCGFTNQRRSNQTSMHSREKRSTSNTPTYNIWNRCIRILCSAWNTSILVKSTRDTKRHSIGERSLTERIDEEYSRSSSDRCAIYNADPRDAYPSDRKVPTHDPCRHRCQSGSGILRVGKDHRYTTTRQAMRLPDRMMKIPIALEEEQLHQR